MPPQKKIPFTQSKLIQLLQLLEPVEIKLFEKWLESPYSNSNKQLLLLYKAIKPFYPEFNSPKLTKQYLFRKIWPKKKYNDRMLRNLMAIGSNQVRKFLVAQQLEHEEMFQKELLIKSYLRRQKQTWFIHESEHLIDQLNNQNKPKSTEELLTLFKLNEQLYHQPSTSYRQNLEATPLFQANQRLDQLYWLHKLRIVNENVEREKKLKHTAQTAEALSYQVNPEDIPLPAIQLYLFRLTQTNTKTADGFFDFKKRFFEVCPLLPFQDQKILLFSVLNDAARLYQQGKAEFLSVLLELYQFGLESKLIVHNNQLTETTFLNITTIGNSLKEFKFTNQFISRYQELLPQNIQQDASVWAKGYTFFHQEQYQACIDEIKDHPFSRKNKTFIHRAKTVLIQALFEVFLADHSYFEIINDHCSSFEQYLRKDKQLNERQIKSRIQFVSYTRKLLTWYYQKQKPGILLNLYQALQKETNIQAIKWLDFKFKEAQERLPKQP